MKTTAIRDSGRRASGRRGWGGVLALALAVGPSACGQAPDAAPEPENPSMQTLPRPRLRGEKSLEETIAARRSVRTYSDRDLSVEELSQILWAAQGVTDSQRGRFRAAPSAGATYPLETYAVTRRGVFRYLPDRHALEAVFEDRDPRPALAEAALGQRCVRAAPLIVVFAAVPDRTTGRYGQRGIMYIHMEAGHAAQNIHLQAVALGLGSVPVGAFDPARVSAILGIPPEEQPIYLVPVGAP